MTATDELRRLLDERGVEYDGKTCEGVTFWNDAANMAVASEDYGGKLWVSQSLTPEQAVEATLGRGTCKRVKEHFEHSGGSYRLVCSECHHIIYDGWQEKPRYCPFCGRRVVNA